MADGEKTILYALTGFLAGMYLMSNYSFLRPVQTMSMSKNSININKEER